MWGGEGWPSTLNHLVMGKGGGCLEQANFGWSGQRGLRECSTGKFGTSHQMTEILDTPSMVKVISSEVKVATCLVHSFQLLQHQQNCNRTVNDYAVAQYFVEASLTPRPSCEMRIARSCGRAYCLWLQGLTIWSHPLFSEYWSGQNWTGCTGPDSSFIQPKG